MNNNIIDLASYREKPIRFEAQKDNTLSEELGEAIQTLIKRLREKQPISLGCF